MISLKKMSSHSVTWIERVALLTVFLNFAFPKAGIYAADFPVTLGYVMGGLCTILFFIRWQIKYSGKQNRYLVCFSVVLLLSSLLFVIVPLLFKESESGEVTYFLIAYLVSPIVAYSTIRLVLKQLQLFNAIILLSVCVVSFFGIVHFIAINYFSTNISIPYLTITGADSDVILEKNINRGTLLKAVSTYNNGNILGVNLLMLFPLTLFLTRSLYIRLSMRALILITLSRTAWAVWVSLELLRALLSRNVKRLLLVIPVVVAGLFFITVFVSQISTSTNAFLFDSTLGGRQDSLAFEPSLLPSAFTPISEIVYAAILKNYGWLGLFLFAGIFAAPLFLRSRHPSVPYAKLGMIGYLIAMGLDGAFTLVPTTFIYWCLASYVYRLSLAYPVTSRRLVYARA